MVWRPHASPENKSQAPVYHNEDELPGGSKNPWASIYTLFSWYLSREGHPKHPHPECPFPPPITSSRHLRKMMSVRFLQDAPQLHKSRGSTSSKGLRLNKCEPKGPSFSGFQKLIRKHCFRPQHCRCFVKTPMKDTWSQAYSQGEWIQYGIQYRMVEYNVVWYSSHCSPGGHLWSRRFGLHPQWMVATLQHTRSLGLSVVAAGPQPHRNVDVVFFCFGNRVFRAPLHTCMQLRFEQ